MHLVGGHLSIGCSRRVMRGRRARVILPVFLLIPFRPVPFFHAFVGGVLAGVLFELA